MTPSVQLSPLLWGSLIVSTVFLSSCASGPPKPNPNQSGSYEAVEVNPYPAGTYAHFTASSAYPKTYAIFRDEDVLAATNPSNSKVIINRQLQRGFLLNNGQLAMDYPIATGTSQFPTPAGKFTILEKKQSGKRSSKYGKIYDAAGSVVNSDADSTKDYIPPGGKFVGASMPYWMRITWTGIGMHQGYVPLRPASHGCIRTYSKAVPTVYSKVAKGTPVVVR
jgi:lipoprotein-anchoring transpeptidase ErfK/SrfK